MNCNVRSGPATVLSSGQATTFGGHGLDVDVQLQDGSWYRVTFSFEDGGPGAEPRVETELEAWGIRLRLHHFAEGRGSAQPVLLGDIGDRLYFLHFRVFRFGKTAERTVSWTFYAVEKQDVGWQAVTETAEEAP